MPDDRPLRIVAFCDHYGAPLRGGAERVTHETSTRLVADGAADVVVVAGVSRRSKVGAPGHLPTVACRGIDFSRFVGGELLVAPTLWWRGWRTVRRVRPDVIHAASIHFVGSLVAAVIAAATATPLVTTVHVAGLGHVARRTRVLGRAWERTVGRFVLWRSAQVIAVSDAAAAHARDLGARHVSVVENGVDADRFRPGRRGDPPVVAVVGRLVANKQPVETASVLTSLPGDARFVFAGSGPLAVDVAEAAADDPRFELLGHVDDVADLVGAADVFVRWSTSEGRSLALLEAMAAGCAVVASDLAANAELIEHDRTGVLVDAHDAEGLRAALVGLLGDPDRRTRLGDAARAEVAAASWAATAMGTGKVLAAAADLDPV